MGWEGGRGKGEGGMQTRNASRMRSNGPGELLANPREGRVHRTWAVGSLAAGIEKEDRILRCRGWKGEGRFGILPRRSAGERKREIERESRLFRLIKRIVDRFPFHTRTLRFIIIRNFNRLYPIRYKDVYNNNWIINTGRSEREEIIRREGNKRRT